MEPGVAPTGPGPVRPFGTTSAGEETKLISLDGGGLRARVTDFGAALVAVESPDRNGEYADVTLGFDDVAGYESADNQYFGATVGRVANRIAGARFSLDGREYELAANEPPNALHGGARRAFSKVVWQVVSVTDTEVELAYTSPDGEEGYPGRLEATVRYRVSGDVLEITYRAVTDQPTPVNLTNHAYWNLAGAGRGTVLDHEITVAADRFTPTDAALIPTGGTAPVDGPLDLRAPTRIGDRIAELASTPALGYDHDFVVRGDPGGVRLAARVHDPSSGRVLELSTDQPGVQVYSGNRLQGQRGKRGRTYLRFGGLCLEPQHHPDSLHRPEFPSIVLRPGQTYEHVSHYRFTTS